MDGTTHGDLQGVAAPLYFMEPMAERPYSYNYDPPPGVPARNGQLMEHKVTVRDARPVNDALSLDDPQTPDDAPPRESIEVRTLVFY